MAPIRVMHVVGRMAGGGVESVVMSYMRAMDPQVATFDLVVDTSSPAVPAAEIQSLGGRLLPVPSISSPHTFASALAAHIRRERPDVVHSHINALSALPLAVAEHDDVPVRIAHSHNTSGQGEYVRNAVKAVLRPTARRHATHLAACSDHAARWLFGSRAIDAGRVRIVPNAIDLERFQYDAAARLRLRGQVGAGAGTLLVGWVGRLATQKNPLYALEAFACLRQARPDVHLVMIGDGPLRDRCRQVVAERELAGSVSLLGLSDEVASWYSAFDVLLFPSRYEGLGLAAVEAQACALPVVVSDRVPREAHVVPELVHVVGLEAGVPAWADALEGAAALGQRRQDDVPAHLLREARLDINQEAARLGRWYQQIVRGTGTRRRTAGRRSRD